MKDAKAIFVSTVANVLLWPWVFVYINGHVHEYCWYYFPLFANLFIIAVVSWLALAFWLSKPHKEEK